MKGEMMAMKTATAMANDSFSRISSHRDAIVRGDAPVRPGQAQATDGLSANDVVPQGDLYVRVCGEREKIPADYVARQGVRLVPGNEDGAQHVLDSIDGVTMSFPPEWGTDLESLRGPFVTVTEPRTVLHHGRRGHGPIHLCPGTYEIRYQRVWDAEQRIERRARD